jgi:hypothetical protein
MNSFTFDVGPRLLALGALYILLKPFLYLLAIALIVIAGYVAYKKYIAHQDPYFVPAEESVYRDQIVLIAIGIILFVVLILRQ